LGNIDVALTLIYGKPGLLEQGFKAIWTEVNGLKSSVLRKLSLTVPRITHKKYGISVQGEGKQNQIIM